ncbi:hypothetical protein LY76DRAFT_590727 [Colletotrichum caudatum]|nr:hypothetical protein LY76DRAFT_590727 [Colletotrichum caudatum]
MGLAVPFSMLTLGGQPRSLLAQRRITRNQLVCIRLPGPADVAIRWLQSNLDFGLWCRSLVGIPSLTLFGYSPNTKPLAAQTSGFQCIGVIMQLWQGLQNRSRSTHGDEPDWVESSFPTTAMHSQIKVRLTYEGACC